LKKRGNKKWIDNTMEENKDGRREIWRKRIKSGEM
jgi:hypothetical protein